MNKRTTYCGLVTEEFLNEKVTLKVGFITDEI